MDAVAAYHALFDDDAVARESCELLHERQCSRGLAFGDRPLSVVLRPQLLEAARYQAAVSASAALFDALSTLGGALLADGELRAELALEPDEERLLLVDPGYRSPLSFARFDGFFTDRIRFVECNGESPAAMAWADDLSAVFESLPVMRSFRRRYHVRRVGSRSRLLATLLRAFREWGKDDVPVAAIVDWEGGPTVTEFEMFRDYFEEHGVRTLICDPRRLELRDGNLFACGERVNLVYRRVLLADLRARADETHALRDAYCAGTVCVVNSFRAKLLDKKIALSLLSDERFAHLFTPAQRAAIASHVPWTRRVRDGATTRAGKRIGDLLAYAAGHREELVLKPNDDYGGKGVVLGWTVTQAEWEACLAAAATQPYVVQEAVPVPRETFPISMGGVRFVEFSVDTDPFVFDGRAAGCLTRLSSSALLNVTAGGGSMVPTYLVDGPRV